jgi:PKD repeat protein
MRSIALLIVVVVLIAGITGITTPVHGLPVPGYYDSPIGVINISAPIPDSPSSVTAYRVVPGPNDMVYYSTSDLEKVRSNVTSEADAPQVAQTILNNYGGLPHEAIINYVKTEYIYTYNFSTNQDIPTDPVSTNVQYARSLDGKPVVGDGAYINMELGDNGELLYLNKAWRTVEPDGDLPIQPVSSAIDKLRAGEVLNPKKDSHDLDITKIRLGYFEKGLNQSEEFLEPAWLFKGTTETGDPIQYYVYARRFANFTATSTNISTFQPIQFNDTSGATPTQWYWDFGDGTNSTDQNPSHVYRISGNFTVSLRAFNDLGSDTETKPDYITVWYQKPLNADFNATPTAASIGDPIQFYDNSDSSPNQWFWDFGDGMNSTEQNPTHAYATSGNYTVNLTAWNSFGSDKRTIENYIGILPDPKPVAGFVSDYIGGSEVFPTTVAFNDTSTGDITEWYWDFDDGTNSTEQNPVHTFAFDATRGPWVNWRWVFLTVTDTYGRTSSYSTYIKFIRNTDLFTGEPTKGASPLTVNFTELPDLPSSPQYIWDFGDGTSYTWSWYPEKRGDPPRNISHTYLADGIYNVTLYMDLGDDGSYSKTKNDYIIVGQVHPVSGVDFTANNTIGKSPLGVAFTDNSTNSPIEWNWDFGDHTNSTDQDPVHVYSAPGNYTVSLTASNPFGSNTSTQVDYITVLPRSPPVASFAATPRSGKVPLTVSFNDTSGGSPDNWTWDFGDGSNATDQNPVHTYPKAGNYSVALAAQNADGTNSTTKIDYITVSQRTPPIAGFTANGTSGKSPLAIAFTDTSTNSPTSWNWTFGDGTLSDEQNPVHIYTATGMYTVSLSVANPDGSDTTSRTGYISASAPVLPVADFTANRTSGNAPLAVAFTESSTGQPATWYWDFGDGKISTSQNPVHPYLSAGVYPVSLTVTNSDGSNTLTRANYITVTAVAGPAANFTAQPTYGKAPLKVMFNDTSTGIPIQWYWTFGDGTNSTLQNPIHTYSSNGKYTVSLTAANAGGSSTKTRTEYIIVSCSANLPVAKFVATPTSGTAPLDVKFTDASTGSPKSWYWNFGDGTNSTVQNPTHVYTSAGKYTVSLTASNSLGSNTRTEKEFITVKSIKPPCADFSGKPTSGRAPLAVIFNDTSGGSPTSWTWNFGDGTNSTDQNPVHRYTSAGKYTISLTASNAGGSDTKIRNQYITVTAPAPTPLPTTIKPTETCTIKPTATCTPRPTATGTTKPTATPTAEPPCAAPHVTGLAGNSTIRLDWDTITDSRLEGYKVVISKNNPDPELPDDGYMYWITDRSQNYSVIDTRTSYNGGDIGGYLKPGQAYYFSITAVYTNMKVPGNVIRIICPAPARTTAALPAVSPEMIPPSTLTTI